MSAAIISFPQKKEETISSIIDDIMLEVAFMFSQQGQNSLLDAVKILWREGKIKEAQEILHHIVVIQDLFVKLRCAK